MPVKTHNAEQRKIKKQLWQYLILANLLGLLAFGVHWYIGLQDKLSISAFVSPFSRLKPPPLGG